MQADVEISFEVSNLREAEVLDYWTDPQILCSKKGSSIKSGLGPFGLLVFASEGLQEYTSVVFRIFRHQHKYLVLLCSDQSRFVLFVFSSYFHQLNFSPNSSDIQTHDRSSLNKDNDLTSYGTFVDVDPLHEKLSLRTLVSSNIYAQKYYL